MIDFLQRVYGALPSPPDKRDYTLDRILAKVPALPREYIIPQKVAVRDQELIGSCVGFSLATAREITEALQGNPGMLSPGFIYANREGHTTEEEGMIPREALGSLVRCGTPPLEEFPYNYTFPNVNRLLWQDYIRLMALAFPQRLTAYVRLTKAEDIKAALMETGPVLACYDIRPSFNQQTNGIIPDRLQGEASLGGHAMALIGWKVIDGVERWILQNSWGTGWGDGGYCYIPTSGYSWREMWGMTDRILPRNPDAVGAQEIRLYLIPGKENTAYLDGEPMELTAKARIIDDRVVVPLRFISEAFGCIVTWEEDKMGQITVYDGSREIRMWKDAKDVWMNGTPYFTDVAPKIVDEGYTMVPLRFIAETLECWVDWDDKTREVIVTRK